MSIRKNNSRAADRVKIKRMTAQGFDVKQISMKLSITEEHIDYVINQYEKDIPQNRAAAKEQMAMREAEAMATRPDPSRPNLPAPGVDVAALKAQMREELLAEMRAEMSAAKAAITADTVEIPPETVDNGETVTEGTAQTESEAAPEKKETPRRRRKKAA